MKLERGKLKTCNTNEDWLCLTYHFGGGMDNFHLLEDSCAVVSDKHFAFGGLDLIKSRNKSLAFSL